MDPTGGRDSRYNLNYSMSMMSESPEIYGNPNVSLARPPSGGLVGQVMSRGGTGGTGLMNANGPQCGSGGGGGGGGGGGLSRGIKRTNSDCYDDRQQMVGSQNMTGLDGCTVGSEVVDDSYTSLQPKKSPPSNGKKTKGRVKIKMEYIDNKLRRYTTFSKRKTGIMKKAYELSTLTGTQVMLLVASETGHVYTFATRKLQPMITSEAGKALIQTCLNSPDPPTGSSGDQRMSATGFEETELSYNIGDEDSKDDRSPMSSGSESDDYSPPESPPPGPSVNISNKSNASSSNNHHQAGSLSEKPSTRSAASQNLGATATPSSAGTAAANVLSANAATINAIQQQIQQQQEALQQQIQNRHQQLQHQKQQPKSGKAKSSTVKIKQEAVSVTSSSTTATVAAATSSTSIAPVTTTAPQITSSIIYPASALSSLPQDMLINLLQSGQIQLHSEGGTQQYVTIPLPLMPGKTTSKSTNSSNGQQKSSSANSTSSTSSNSSVPVTSARTGSGSSSSRRNQPTVSTIKTEVLD